MQLHRSIYFFFMAFSAALVCLPSRTLGVVALMTPTATVCLMSRTANLRLQWYWDCQEQNREDSPSEWREVSEGLDTHGLARGQPHDGGVTGLDELGVVLDGFTGTTVNLLLDLGKLESRIIGRDRIAEQSFSPCRRCERCDSPARGCTHC